MADGDSGGGGWWSAVKQYGPAVAQLVGGAVGSAQQNAYTDEGIGLQREAYNKALELINSGALSYSPAQAAGVGPSAMTGVGADPNAMLAEREALGELGRASKEGYNDIDRAAINAMLAETGAAERGHREAALARLDPNSGAAMAARMSAQQSGANQANQQALQIAAQSRAKALAALGQYGNMASRVRGESFGEGAHRAQAQDAISRFNAETSRWNAGASNQAAQQGIGNRIAAGASLTGAANPLAAALAGRGQQAFNQTMGAAGGAGNLLASLGGDGKSQGDTSDPNNLTALSSNPYPDEDPESWRYPTNYDIRDPGDK